MKVADGQLDLVPEERVYRTGLTLFFRGPHCEVLMGRRMFIVRIRCGECGCWHGSEVGRQEVALAFAEAAAKTQGMCTACLPKSQPAPKQAALL